MINKKKYSAQNCVVGRNKESGFALIEVMLSALVMAIGCVAFLKLQTGNLKEGHNNYSRTQAVTISSAFVERLRGNKSFLGLSAALKSGSVLGNISPVVPAPQSNSACSSAVTNKDCVVATLNYQRYLTNLQMLAEFPNNLSLLCYQEDDTPKAVRGYMRITFLWRDNQSNNKTALTNGNCPGFSDSDVERNNSVTIYAQL